MARRRSIRHALLMGEIKLFRGDTFALIVQIANGLSSMLDAKGGNRPYAYSCADYGFGSYVMEVVELKAAPAKKKPPVGKPGARRRKRRKVAQKTVA
jgi:hypothetical protein